MLRDWIAIRRERWSAIAISIASPLAGSVVRLLSHGLLIVRGLIRRDMARLLSLLDGLLLKRRFCAARS